MRPALVSRATCLNAIRVFGSEVSVLPSALVAIGRGAALPGFVASVHGWLSCGSLNLAPFRSLDTAVAVQPQTHTKIYMWPHDGAPDDLQKTAAGQKKRNQSFKWRETDRPLTLGRGLCLERSGPEVMDGVTFQFIWQVVADLGVICVEMDRQAEFSG
jgi:hypothetical protein